MTNDVQQPEEPLQGGDPEGPSPEDLAAAAEKDHAEIELLRAELEELKSKYTRALADFQNYQRRSFENEKEARRQGVQSVVQSVLTVLDHFDLALNVDPKVTPGEQVLAGVRLIRDELVSALRGQGVSLIEPKPGEDFDPHRHEAVTQTDPPEGVRAGQVVATLAPGVLYQDRTLRPAKVSVARMP